MSAYRNLYDDVFNRLEQMAIINTVLDYNEQPDNAEQYNLVKYPAVYVETGDVEWNKNQNNFYEFGAEPQTGTAQIIIHIVYHTLKQFNKEVKDEYFGIVDEVVSCLQKLQSNPTSDGTYSTLLRVREEYLTPSKQLREAILTFETQLTDVFAERNTIQEQITFTLAMDIVDEAIVTIE